MRKVTFISIFSIHAKKWVSAFVYCFLNPTSSSTGMFFISSIIYIYLNSPKIISSHEVLGDYQWFYIELILIYIESKDWFSDFQSISFKKYFKTSIF